MKRDSETTGPPYRKAPLPTVLKSPTPLITVRDEPGELLIEGRSVLGRGTLFTALVSTAFTGMCLAIHVGAALVILLTGVSAWSGFSVIREIATTTVLRLRAREILIEQSGPLSNLQCRLSLSEIELPRTVRESHGRWEDCYLLIRRKSDVPGEGVRLFPGHKAEHLIWLSTLLSTRIRSNSAL